jgi:P pilus assembly chaperone PapD
MQILKKVGQIHFILWLIVLFPTLGYAAPELVIKDTRVVLDKPVYQGETVQGKFTINNRGDSDLIIQKVSPG